jgi:hypothetical protein
MLVPQGAATEVIKSVHCPRIPTDLGGRFVVLGLHFGWTAAQLRATLVDRVVCLAPSLDELLIRLFDALWAPRSVMIILMRFSLLTPIRILSSNSSESAQFPENAIPSKTCALVSLQFGSVSIAQV